jgi:DNA-binding XRE family transcriptional regulator
MRLGLKFIAGGDGGGPISGSPTNSNGATIGVVATPVYLAIAFYRSGPSISLAEAIKTAREALGWKQKDLATQVGVHPKTVANWERGTKVPHARQKRALAHILGLSG